MHSKFIDFTYTTHAGLGGKKGFVVFSFRMFFLCKQSNMNKYKFSTWRTAVVPNAKCRAPSAPFHPIRWDNFNGNTFTLNRSYIHATQPKLFSCRSSTVVVYELQLGLWMRPKSDIIYVYVVFRYVSDFWMLFIVKFGVFFIPTYRR